MVEHPSYDGYWQSQALDKLLAAKPLAVPTMWEQGLWDQEDMWGAIHSYRALKAKGTPDNMNMLVMGPWFHSQVNREGRALGMLLWASDTTAQWRREVLLPFFNQYLKPGSPKAETPPVRRAVNKGARWRRGHSFLLLATGFRLKSPELKARASASTSTFRTR